MRQIKNLLIDLEYYGALNTVDEYLQDNDIASDLVIESLVFDKEIFPDKENVREWLVANYFEVYEEIAEVETQFTVAQLDITEFMADSLTSIEVRSGVTALIGNLKLFSNDVCCFSLRNEKSIKLNADLPHVIEIAKVVQGYHPAYGNVEITVDMLKSFIKNFNDEVYGIDLSIDYDHEVKEAAGWYKSLFLSFDEQTLYAAVKWTPKGALSLGDREFRYFSPEFTSNYIHPHSGVEHGPTLLGGALVNRPFLKMDAIVSLKDKQIKKEDTMDTIKLSEHNTAIEKKDLEIKKLQLSTETAKNVIEKMKEENKQLSEKISKIEEDKKEADRVADLDKMFSEKEINKAQYDLMLGNANASVKEVIALSDKMNVAPKGGNKPNPNDTISLSDDERAVCKAMNITPEEYVKYNK